MAERKNMWGAEGGGGGGKRCFFSLSAEFSGVFVGVTIYLIGAVNAIILLAITQTMMVKTMNERGFIFQVQT